MLLLSKEETPMKQSVAPEHPQAAPIPGYDYGQPQTAHSPVSLQELHRIEAAAGWSAEDARVLQAHRDVFEKRAEDMVNTWRAVIGAQPHLAQWFFSPDG